MDQREVIIETALNYLDKHPNASLRAVAKAHNLPRSTLQSRRKGVRNYRTAHEAEQRLSMKQEEDLVQWILEQDANGYPPSLTRTRELVTFILRTNGDTRPLGHIWISAFIRRNPRIASVIGRKIEALRIHGTRWESLLEFYNHFEAIKTRYGIANEDIWNMDEHGIAVGLCTNTRVLASSRKTRTYNIAPQNREWVSIIECISATGAYIKPLIIFKGKSVQSSWFEDCTPDWIYTTSENGWTSHRVAIGWLNDIFIPETQRSPVVPRLLLMDGHGSHVDIEFQYACRMVGIHIVILPPHSSHVLQPLDLAVFSALKNRYRRTIADLAWLDDGDKVKKRRFLTAYNDARTRVFIPSTLQAGWRAAGIVPWEPRKGLNLSQIIHPLDRPTTPPRIETTQPQLEPVLYTPKNHREVYENIQLLQKSKEIYRNVTKFGVKISKALSGALSQQALDQYTIHTQAAKIQHLQDNKKRKRVRDDPNTRFSNIVDVYNAQQELKKQPRKKARKPTNFIAANDAPAPAATPFESCQFEWHL